MDAIILAGGFGSRLQSVVSDVPKCMAEVAGKPFLYHLFRYLIPFQPKRVILSLGYKHEIIEDWVRGLSLPFEVICKVEPTPLGTGGAIKFALSAVKEEEAVILNGDTFFDVDLSKILDFHQSKANAEATLALKPMKEFSRYGAVALDRRTSRIVRFEEKRFYREGLINGGIYVVKRDALDAFPEKFSMENDYFAVNVKEGKLSGYICDRYFIDIGIPEDYARAQQELKNKSEEG